MDKEKKRKLVSEYKETRTPGGIYSITNTAAKIRHIGRTKDLRGMENRFNFGKKSGTPLHLGIAKEWETYGRDAFIFEVLEELKWGETQTDKEYDEDLKTLGELWLEKEGK